MARYTVVPAYNRDYKSAKAAVADWKAGMDFRIMTNPMDQNDGRYCSINDGFKVTIRYNRRERMVNA